MKTETMMEDRIYTLARDFLMSCERTGIGYGARDNRKMIVRVNMYASILERTGDSRAEELREALEFLVWGQFSGGALR